MTTLPVSADGQAIVLATTTLALHGNRSLKPLSAVEWHTVSRLLHGAELRPHELIGVRAPELRELLDIPPSAAERLAALLERGGQLALEVERLASRGIWILTRADDAYPAQLRQRLGPHAPPVLFGAGPQAALQLPAIAVVGSRDVRPEGLGWAELIGRRCARQGFAVVSGAARGVDAAAMDAAVAAGGAAVGVLADPLERTVTRRDLRIPIAEELLTLVTPFHPAARWHAGNAMKRNRLIYALAQAAVVVASSVEKGGTRTGALENLGARWVPLHVLDDGSAGNRRLIAEGGWAIDPGALEHLRLAALAEATSASLLDGADAESDAGRQAPASEPPPTEAEPADVFAAAWPVLARHLREPVGERDFAERTGLEPKQARVWLTRALDEGLVELLPRPKRYVLCAEARGQLHFEKPKGDP